MPALKLTIATPEKKLFEGEADSVSVPGQEGQLTILAGHAPLLSSLSTGKIKVMTTSGEEAFEANGGLIEVNETGATIFVKP
jgi:F-type H+-transporting ATPase subunit epsilon